MTFYNDMRSVADELLSEFKQGAVEMVDASNTTIALNATVRGVPARHVDGSLVMESDLIVTFAVPSDAPTLQHWIRIDGKLHTIQHIEPLPAAGTTVAYRARVRA
jgi:hypothetical protein